MIGRLRVRLTELLDRLRRPRERRGQRSAPPAGRARNVIVVKPRDPRFSEIVYVLRDEAFAEPGCDREALLRQAREAARADAGRALPAGARFPLWAAGLFLLGAVLILKLAGVL